MHHSNFASHRIHPNQRIKQLRRSLLPPELHTPDPLYRVRSSIDSIYRQDPLEYQTFSTSSPSNSNRTSIFLFCDFDFSFGIIRDSFYFPWSDLISRILRSCFSIYDPNHYRFGRPGRSYHPISYSLTAATPTRALLYTIYKPTYGIALKLPVNFKL